MAEDDACSCAQGGGGNGLHEFTSICLLMVGALEHWGYTCIHQLQSDRRPIVTFRESLDIADSLRRPGSQAPI